MASSLMADSLAVAGQALVAQSLGGGGALTATGRERAIQVAERVLQLALLLGFALAALLGLFRHAIAALFTQDLSVLLFLSGKILFDIVLNSYPTICKPPPVRKKTK